LPDKIRVKLIFDRPCYGRVSSTMVDAGIKQVGRDTAWGRSWTSGAARSLVGVVATLAVVAVGALSARRAEARPEYPGKLQTVAAMDCTPACTLCHSDPAGGKENLRTDTTIWSTLVGAIGTQSDAGLMGDTDGDGTSDLNELRAGTDPGSKANTLICTPLYGCFARVARSAPQQPRSTWSSR
jgi:hypothetical protein